MPSVERTATRPALNAAQRPLCCVASVARYSVASDWVALERVSVRVNECQVCWYVLGRWSRRGAGEVGGVSSCDDERAMGWPDSSPYPL